MKKISLILGIMVILSILALAYFNYGSFANINYLENKTINVNSAVLILILAFYSGFGAFLVSYYSILGLAGKLKKQSRNTEKASIESSESADRIKILESKIKTLETALKGALTKK